MNNENETTKYPLYVDLDGTFLKTDMLHESFMSAIKKNPLVILYCLLWLAKGIPHLKKKLALYTEIDTASMPKNQEFFQFLSTEKDQGRKIILATASSQVFAQQVVAENSLFDDYISTTDSVNLKGKKKLNKIVEQNKAFAYAGNDGIDFEIFSQAQQAFLVNPTQKALNKSKHYDITQVFDKPVINKTVFWIKQLRLHQWLKNLLIFVPLMVSGLFMNIDAIFATVIAFISFSLLASSTYILNDLLDLNADRLHPRKRKRPIAAGMISIPKALTVSFGLFIISMVIALNINLQFTVVIISYLILTLSYSFVIKQYIGMDVVMLAILYTVRIFAGAYALNIQASFWLLTFSVFIFLSLALVKRCSEIHSLQSNGKERSNGRDYSVTDYEVLSNFGASSALLSVLMFIFYINNGALSNQYQQPDILWLIIPCISYWLMRMWIKTHRGEMHDDPIVFSLKDKGSIVTIGFCCLVAVVAQLI